MNEGLIFAAVLILVAGFALAIGYLWGSKNGVNAVLKELEENPLLTVEPEEEKDELGLGEFYSTHPLPKPEVVAWEDGLLGSFKVYREFLPRRDADEYTVYFQHDDVKQRMDFLLTSEEYANIHTDDLENFVRARIHQNYAEGNYAPAAGYIKEDWAKSK